MLQIKFIQENADIVIERLKIKNFNASGLVPELLATDEERRQTQKSLDDKLAEANQLAREIGGLFKQGKVEEAQAAKSKSTELKDLTRGLNSRLDELKARMEELLLQLPNLPHPSVPPGRSAEDNELVSQEGEIPEMGEEAVPHWELAAKYDIIDFNLGSKVTGAGFPFYKGKGAKLQRALINFFLDEALDAGYIEYQPPLAVNADSAYGTGQLPDKDGQMYVVEADELYLVPTAEVPITNIYRDTIMDPRQFPVRNVAYSSCFRREAGSYGKDVRGLNRLHQFDKVEIVQVQVPEKSYASLDEMTAHVSSLLRKLELPFRVVRLCGGDTSFTSALTYDFEVYSAAQKKWLEVSSVSNFESFQSNRMKMRYKDTDGKIKLVHTLNGSALALPRVVAALLENNQSGEGIVIPEVLRKYTGFDIID